MKRVAIIGSTGQLGTDLVAVMAQAGDYEVLKLSHREIECTDPVSVERALKALGPDIVVDCAAFVRVDEAEDRAEEALRVNGLGAPMWRGSAQRSRLSVYISARTTYLMAGRMRPISRVTRRGRSIFTACPN